MNQTRLSLLLAWFMVATLLWVEWGKEKAARLAPAPAAVAVQAIPQVVPGAAVGAVPSATPASSGVAAATSQAPQALTIITDVLRVQLDGGTVRRAELLKYPRTRGGSEPVRLFDDSPASYYVAQTGWAGQGGSAAPAHGGFVPAEAGVATSLALGQAQLVVPFIWQGPDGVTIRRNVRFTRGSYAIEVQDSVVNAGTRPWQGYVYRQLLRTPPHFESGPMHPESYSFVGATWYDAKNKEYNRRPFKDYLDGGSVDADIAGGWLAMPQHHFVSLWVPQKDQTSRYSLSQAGNVDAVAAVGPGFTLAPGEQASTSARLWVGPKDVAGLHAMGVPQIDRAIDYSRFSIFAVLGQWLFKLLAAIHGVLGNWGWAIVALTLGLKLLLFPLSNQQYKSAAKMRRLQPRMKALQERYGDDKQKLQMAMMELYKTEKINPVGGCLPLIPQMLIFMTLYWVLSESVELRHAPWIGWIQDLTARDPFFVLPALNAGIMIATQHLMPAAPGMDPTQQKMMKLMPVVFGFVLAFLPAGLVLYQVTNGLLTLAQQWYMTRKYGGDAPEVIAAAKNGKKN